MRVVAQDLLQFGEKNDLLSSIGRLLTAPVRTSVALAQDTSFRGHTALFVLAIAISTTYTKLLSALSGEENQREHFWTELGEQNSVLNVLTKLVSADTISLIVTYSFFLISYVVSYFVFQDYSGIQQTPRGYLKLSCISTLVNTIIFGIMLCSGPALVALHFPPIAVLSAVIIIVIGGLSGILYYYFKTHIEFWRMSGVRTFRSMIISLMLAFFVTVVIYSMLGLILAAALFASHVDG